MSQKKYIILDKDSDQREANNCNEWNDVPACLADIKEGIIENIDEIDYLPWRIVEWDAEKDRDQMLLHTRIKNIKRGIHLTTI